MAAEGAACSDRPRLGHVVSVLSDGFLRYNTVGRIEHAVLANAVKLLGEDVNTFTLYDRRGLLRRHFSSTYGGCFRRAILDRQGCKDITQRFGDYLEVSADFDGHHEMSNEGKSSYFLESADGKLLLSQFDPSHHSSQRGIRLCFLDQSCAHRRVLSSKIRRYSLSDDWVVSPGVYVGGIELKYRIPPGEHISQPDLQRQLYLVDGAELPPPELVVSVQPGLRDVMRFCAGYVCMQLLMLVACLFPRLGGPRLCPRFDLGLLFCTIFARLGSVCSFSGPVIYSFGPCGIPPWFLAEAELHQCFGLGVAAFWHCVDRFYHCQRRNGK